MGSKILYSSLLFFIISSPTLLFGQCPSSLIFSNQSQIDNFATNYPNCTEINETVTIEEINSGNITNLNGLSQITKVKNLKIFNNQALTNLDGLNNLTAITDGSIYGKLYIINNPSLQNLDGLENLQEILEDIRIVENPSLTSIEGLQNVSIITPDIGIQIKENPSLLSLQGLNGITIANALVITLNDMLSNLNGLNNLTEISELLEINVNQNLTTLEGLNSLVSVGGQGLKIYSNPSLESFDGLENLVSIQQSYFMNNTALINIEALGNFTSSAEMFGISNSPLLTNLHGLENLNSVGFLIFGGLDSLNDISALSNVDMTSVYSFYLSNCPLLSVCDYPNICQYLNTTSNNDIIYNNAPGCSTREEILQSCGLLNNNENIMVNNFSIHPNPTTNTFTVSGIEKGKVKITDSRGRILKSFTLMKDEISLTGLAEGIYFVNITNEKGSLTKQVIKI